MNEKIKKMFESKKFTKVLCMIGAIIILMLTFSAGVNVGFHKASFGRSWGDHYNENFGIGHKGEDSGRFGMMDHFPNAHGAAGKIIKLGSPTIIVQDRDNIEKVILITADTKIERARTEIKAVDLAVDDFIVVIGSPNVQGQIEAKFIRVIPSPDFLNKTEKTNVQ